MQDLHTRFFGMTLSLVGHSTNRTMNLALDHLRYGRSELAYAYEFFAVPYITFHSDALCHCCRQMIYMR